MAAIKRIERAVTVVFWGAALALGAEEAPPAPPVGIVASCPELGPADLMVCRDFDGDGTVEYAVAGGGNLRIYHRSPKAAPGKPEWTLEATVPDVPAVVALVPGSVGAGKGTALLAICDPEGGMWARRDAMKAKKELPQRLAAKLIDRVDGKWRVVSSLDLPCAKGSFPGVDHACADPAGKRFIVVYRRESSSLTSCDAIRWNGSGLELERDAQPAVHVAGARALYSPGARGKPRWLIGRGYKGDDTAKPQAGWNPEWGYLFFQDGGKREPLTTFRGVSRIAVGDVDGDGTNEILVNDGWHYDYGKVARCRVACLSKKPDGAWEYRLIEDIPKNMRLETLECADLDGDGRDEVITSGQPERPGTFQPSVRIYRLRKGRWEVALPPVKPGVRWPYDIDNSGGPCPGLLVAIDENGDGRNDALYQMGSEPRRITLDGLAWSADLHGEVKTEKVDPASLAGKPAPELEIAYWVGGKGASLADLKGKVVVLDFTASWCGPCRKLTPVLEGWMKELGPKGLAVLGVTGEDGKQTKADIEKAYGAAPYPTAVSKEQRCHLAYGVGPIPHLVWIDRNGAVRGYRTGFSPAEMEKLRAQLQELLDAPAGQGESR